ncbi:WXG100 family type VII secretion target [Nocardia sp. CA-084685]|uniref:WXG100 family type VII secretion target n=1 Tax=Nocardia sp. CA-084685 TaxID=3239970 RepID=UPI003D98EDB3
MADWISVDFHETNKVADRLKESAGKLGDLGKGLEGEKESYEASPCWGTDDIGKGCGDNYGKLMNQNMSLLANFEKSLSEIADRLNYAMSAHQAVEGSSAQAFAESSGDLTA